METARDYARWALHVLWMLAGQWLDPWALLGVSGALLALADVVGACATVLRLVAAKDSRRARALS